MWTSIPNFEKKNGDFFFKYSNSDERFQFYMTNFVDIWELKLLQSEFLSLIEKNNPLLEANGSSFGSHCMEKLFESISQKNVESIIRYENPPNKDVLLLEIKILQVNFPFKIKLKLNLSTSLTFSKEVTTPLMILLRELRESEDHLVECIIKKDVEIQEYKIEGAKLPFKHLETPTFNKDEHRNQFSLSTETFFNSRDILPITKKLLEKCHKTDKAAEHFKIEPTNSQGESKTENDSSRVLPKNETPCPSELKTDNFKNEILDEDEDKHEFKYLSPKRKKGTKRLLNLY